MDRGVRAELGFILDPQDHFKARDPAGGKVEKHIPGTTAPAVRSRSQGKGRASTEPQAGLDQHVQGQEPGQCGCSRVGSEWSHLRIERMEGQGTLSRVTCRTWV